MIKLFDLKCWTVFKRRQIIQIHSIHIILYFVCWILVRRISKFVNRWRFTTCSKFSWLLSVFAWLCLTLSVTVQQREPVVELEDQSMCPLTKPPQSHWAPQLTGSANHTFFTSTHTASCSDENQPARLAVVSGRGRGCERKLGLFLLVIKLYSEDDGRFGVWGIESALWSTPATFWNSTEYIQGSYVLLCIISLSYFNTRPK